MRPDPKMVAVCFLLLSLALYMSSLFQTAFCLDPTGLQGNPATDCFHGWAALVWGGIGVVSAAANLTWLANPILLFAWLVILVGVRRVSIAFCLVAFAIAATFAATQTVTRPPSTAELRDAALLSLGVGYWLWLASIATALIAAILFPRSKLEWP
jgi:hypothetical protein